MLSISAMSSRHARYYLDLAREDYYLEGGEPPGRWWRGDAAKLGLGEFVTRTELTQLLAGFSPQGDSLIQNAGKSRHQPGWDLTFSAPKSVSVVWSQADEETRRAIQEAHRSAVSEALAYLQDEVASSRVGKDGNDQVPATLIVAQFEHGTSRALDPQLHTHCLVMNVGIRRDGTTGTIVSKSFYLHKMTAGALYRAHLASELARLGFDCQLKGRFFEIQGVPQSLVDEFSKRRKEIEEQLGLKGLESATAAAFATLATRKWKHVVPARSELFAQWQQVGALHGFEIGQLYVPPGPDITIPYDSLIQQAIQELTEKHDHFSRRELLRRTAELSQRWGLPAPFLRGLVSEAVVSSPIVPLARIQEETRFTTRDRLKSEARLLRSANSLASQKSHRVSKSIVDGLISRYSQARSPTKEELLHHGRQLVRAARRQRTTPVDREKLKQDARRVLSAEQADAVRHLVQGGESLSILAGLPGTGKTTTLSVCREAFEKAGYRVWGAALSAKAARELQKHSGIRSYTLKQLELLMRDVPLSRALRHHGKQLLRAAFNKPTSRLKPFRIDRKTVLVVDEAAMIGKEQMTWIMDAVTKGGGKVILAGDPSQLQPLESGAPFASMLDRFKPFRLTEMVRQRDPANRDTIKGLAHGNAKQELWNLAARGILAVEPDRPRAMAKLVSDWFAVHAARPSDTLIFCGTNDDAQQLNQLCQHERFREGLLQRDAYVSVDSRNIYVGDRVLVTKNSRPLRVQNGDIGTVVAKGRLKDSLTVVFDDDRKVVIPIKSFPHLRLGYAVTTHKGQGTTVESSFVLLGGRMQDRELTLVQASRARGQTRYYTDEAETGPDFASLAKKMSKSQAKELTIDLARRHENIGLEMER